MNILFPICLDLTCCFQIHTIAIIAEGIPEAQTRRMIKLADEKGVTIIGPATVRSFISPNMSAEESNLVDCKCGECLLM